MNKISFTSNAWGDYCYWQQQDKKTLKRINILLEDICRNKFTGIGKPEPLKNELSSFWSRRIDEVNRLVYRINNEQIEIIQCKGHYDKTHFS
ncbi:MAG: Txe/YoeB family addiction module toxin [Clostridia bacterium]|nr:Txe/YoeB family addiction module toxin [Clostridia bacterium]